MEEETKTPVPEETQEKKTKKKSRLRAWWQNHKPTKRRIIQLYAALLTNANIKGFASGRIYGGTAKYACVPGLNCYSCPGAVGACPLGSLQNALAQSGTRFPFYVLGILLLFGLLLARTICGFLCPFGLVQDLLYKVKTPKLKKSRFTRVLSYLKYVVLVVFVFALPTIYGVFAHTALPAFCKYICPAGTLGGAVALLSNAANEGLFASLHGLFTWKFCLMVGIVVACIFIYRAFCRFLCPLGAIYGFFNRFALLGVKLDKNKCTDCGLCTAHCKMDIRHVGDHECINCGECIDVCPAKAISWKGSKFFLHQNAVYPVPAPETEERPIGSVLSVFPVTGGENAEQAETLPEAVGTKPEAVGSAPSAIAPKAAPSRKALLLRIAAWVAALAVLISALVYFNACDRSKEGGTTLEGGNKIGDICYDFSLPCYLKEGTFTLSEHRGKIIVINFWATWCGGCVAELPDFERVQEEYADEVEIIAVHSADVQEDVVNYIERQIDANDGTRTWSDWSLTFVQDSGDVLASETYDLLGGSSGYPMTVIVDREGVIRFSREGSVSYNTLNSTIKLLLME